MSDLTSPRAELGAALTALQDAAQKWDVPATIAAKRHALAVLDALTSALHDAQAIGDFSEELRDRRSLQERANAADRLAARVQALDDALDPELLARIQAAYESAVHMRFIAVKLELADVEQLLGVGVHAR